MASTDFGAIQTENNGPFQLIKCSGFFATHHMISASASNQTFLAFCLNKLFYQSRRVLNDLLVKQYFCILSNNLINNWTIWFYISTLVLLSYNSANK